MLLYWSKVNRLLRFSPTLVPLQQLIVGLWLLFIILIPTTLSMTLIHKGGGSVYHWTSAQTCNTALVGTYFMMDLGGLAFTSLLHPTLDKALLPSDEPPINIRHLLLCQLPGFILLLCLVLIELFYESFNDQFVYIVPMLLILGEVLMWNR